MWQCPKCGRMFKNTGQNHFCSDTIKSIDDYIAGQDDSVQLRLREVYAAIKGALPDAQEIISWRMPTFWRGKNLIHFAVFKNHIGLYPGDKGIAHFSERLKEYKTSKGAVQLPLEKPLPLALIAEIAKWCGEEYGN